MMGFAQFFDNNGRLIEGPSFYTTDNLNEGSTNLYHTSERVDDRVAALLQAGTNITLTYNDPAGQLTIDAASGATNLDGLSDVTISSPSTGQVLRKSAGDWVNSAIQAGDLPSHNHAAGDLNSGQVALARGGTAADLSAAGGTNYLRMNSGGTAVEARTPSQVVTDISAVPTTRTVSAGTGLSGGGDLSTNRTLALDINGLSAETTADNADTVAIYDNSATALKKMTRANFLSGVSGTVIPSTNDFRLTLTSGTPVTTADVTGASTIYLTPFKGRYIALYDGSAWQLKSTAEISLALSSLTSGKNYDVFCYDNSGTITLELSAAWTNDTTRADALTTQDGVYVKSGATTRRWVGIIRTTGTTTTEDSASKRYVCNATHEMARRVRYHDDTNSWTQTTGSAWERWRNQSAAQVSMVCHEATLVEVVVIGAAQASSGHAGAVGCKFDWSSGAPDADGINSQTYSGPTDITTIPSVYSLTKYPGLGYHTLDVLHAGTAAVTWLGDNGVNWTAGGMTTGMEGKVWA